MLNRRRVPEYGCLLDTVPVVLAFFRVYIRERSDSEEAMVGQSVLW